MVNYEIQSLEVSLLGVLGIMLDECGCVNFCLLLHIFAMCLTLTEITFLVEKWAWFCTVITFTSETLGILCCGTHILITFYNGFNGVLSSPCIIACYFTVNSKDNKMSETFCRVRSVSSCSNFCWVWSWFTPQSKVSLNMCSNESLYSKSNNSVFRTVPYTVKYFRHFCEFAYWIWTF